MKVKKRGGTLLIWTALLLLFITTLGPDTVLAEVVIIANKSVSVDKVTKDDLQKYFTGKQVVWGNGQSIKPAILKKGSVHEDFINHYVGKSTSQFTTYWRRMVFTGQGIQPRSFGSTQDMIEYVAETPGAVGYISSSENSPKTKTLTVSGN